jgi:hypothetical protein
MVGTQLWPEGPPPLRYGQPERFQSLWQKMKELLLGVGQDWDVWTAWYEDRLKGHHRKEEHELAYVQIDNHLWNQGPAIVNAEIKRRIKALEANPPPIDAIPEQEPRATRFGVNSDGLIHVVPDPPAPGTASDLFQTVYYDEMRFKSQALVELGPNQLGDLGGPARRFREALKDRIEDISITSLWSRGNTLRRRLKAHDLSMSNGEPDPARLPPSVAETLGDLVDTWNIFIDRDPEGRELDKISLGPQEVQEAKQVVAAAAPIIEARKMLRHQRR